MTFGHCPNLSDRPGNASLPRERRVQRSVGESAFRRRIDPESATSPRTAVVRDYERLPGVLQQHLRFEDQEAWPMEVVICPSPAVVGELAAAKVGRVCRDVGPDVVLGVATGSSPLSLYDRLAAAVAAGELDLTRARAFALDEYVGLPPGQPESYASVIDRTVTRPLGLHPSRVHLPDGNAADIPAACAAYERAITEAGGIDVQILGVGANGHIGFNEPGSSLSSRTRIKTLAVRTRQDNARFFGSLESVPTHCVTQGLGTIMAAREVVLVAHGGSKAHAIAAVVEGPVTASCPGSVLQFHERATVIVDEDAAAEFSRADEYRHTWANKPAWQSWR